MTVDVPELIQKAFSNRKRPSNLYSSAELTGDEIEAVISLQKFDRYHVPISFLQANYDVVFWLSPEAFCYWLPEFVLASIKTEKTLLIVDSIIAMLDRSSNAEYWDDFFKTRWVLLSKEELEAMEGWVLWLTDSRDQAYDLAQLDRAFDVIGILKALK
ncbi:hypothetical protein FT643_14380 [Ketobacter sp. MCCC 1A13808]|uniref:hypothetical protein n=1 Tax=Ketobacter sp. MCCC 1A13808 TaxID=2602738 RepID=UPI000F175467|nr:hypothetical protein [Ketobacter sp. MCCC 1A13808]MVF13324.1 hypothetical protein [Ketobacter sp. MCCC 1A13808]RLP54311.1 MAG: hypothetical protein D6160_11675 [Ketobacter sp.]